MTEERDPETLEIFIEESIEGLQRMERLLMDAESGNARPDATTVLFRDFHTIKGTSGFLSLPRILELSHAGEDLLAVIRDRTTPVPRKPEAALLVRVLDALRTMIEVVRQTNDEPADLDVSGLVKALHDAIHASGAEPEQVSDADIVTLPTPPPAPPRSLLELVPPPEHAPVAAPTPPPSLMAPPPAPPRPAAPEVPAMPRAELMPPPVVIPVVHAPAPAPPPAPALVAVPALVEPPAAPPAAPTAQASPAESTDGGTVRVNVGVLDRLMNLIGELVLARNQLVQTVKQPGDAGATLQRLSHVTSELQEQVMKTRMQPVARVFERLPRMVRDLSATTKKQVSVHIDGNSTEIDRALVEAIRDPVMHIIRNSIDHGIETPAEREAIGKPAVGRINVRAAHEGGMVLIEIRDDGRGIDPRKVRDVAIRRGVVTAQEAARLTDRDAQALVFQPGFSTAAEVTDISGRGVGMDVVRSHVERAGGKVDLDSSVGVGTVIRLKMPLTLAIVPALLVRSGGHRFAIPQVNLTELVHIPEENAERAIEWLCGVPVFRLRGEVLPLVSLSDTLKMPKPSGLGISIVVVAVGDQRYGLLVDEINDTEEIVVKPLSGWLKRLPCYAGATVLGDGGIALILEVTGIATMSGIKTRSSTAALVSMEATTALQPHVLVECGEGEQCAVPLGMVARLENVATTQIERVGGEEVLQYRGAVIPVIRVERMLPMGQTPPSGTHQSLLVFEFASPVAVAVNRVIDIANIAVENTSAIGPAGSFGRQVVLGRATTRLDVYALVEQLAPSAMAPIAPPNKKTVLVIDDNLAWRGGVADQLRAMGATVHEARSIKDVLRAPRTTYQNCDVVIYASGEEDQETVVNSLKSVMVIEPQLLFVARPGRRPIATGSAVVVERSDRASIAAAALSRRAA